MSGIYKNLMALLDKVVPAKLQPLWNHAAGPKTVNFWAPTAKGGLVCAGLGDLTRPTDQLSIPQSIALAVTGVIWSRWSLVIIPKNYFLFCVNVVITGTQVYQIFRAYRHRQNIKRTKASPASTKDEV